MWAFSLPATPTSWCQSTCLPWHQQSNLHGLSTGRGSLEIAAFLKMPRAVQVQPRYKIVVSRCPCAYLCGHRKAYTVCTIVSTSATYTHTAHAKAGCPLSPNEMISNAQYSAMRMCCTRIIANWSSIQFEHASTRLGWFALQAYQPLVILEVNAGFPCSTIFSLYNPIHILHYLAFVRDDKKRSSTSA